MTTILRNSLLTASINHKGAELFSLKNTLGKEYMWNGNSAFWSKHSPVLFPIVGTLKNNSYLSNNTAYTLTRHGFARDMDFNLIEKSDESATFSLYYSDETLRQYPFKFELRIIYILIKNTLHVRYQVLNHDNAEMPFSIGAHPAFALPGNFENYNIEFDKEEILQYCLLENDLISKKTDVLKVQDRICTLNYSLFKNDALVFTDLKSKSITILHRSKPLLQINFEDFPHLGIWTKENAPFLCIEPWFGFSDHASASGNLYEKEGIQVLQSGGKFTSKFTIEILE